MRVRDRTLLRVASVAAVLTGMPVPAAAAGDGGLPSPASAATIDVDRVRVDPPGGLVPAPPEPSVPTVTVPDRRPQLPYEEAAAPAQPVRTDGGPSAPSDVGASPAAAPPRPAAVASTTPAPEGGRVLTAVVHDRPDQRVSPADAPGQRARWALTGAAGALLAITLHRLRQWGRAAGPDR